MARSLQRMRADYPSIEGGRVRKLLISAVAMTAVALLLAPSALAVDDINTQRLRNGVTPAAS